jgi:hypothetical protein
MLMELFTYLIACIKATKEERRFNEELRKEGLKIAISRCAQEINKTIHSKEVAIKFVLQELDFAQKEEIFPKEFILNSGFHKLEYEDALNRFQESKVELFKIQTLFDDFLRKIKKEKEMVTVSINILEQIMQNWEIGKYSLARGESEYMKPKISPEPIEIPEEKIEIPTENIETTPPKEERVEKEIEEPKPIQYDSKRVNQLMEEYSDIIGDIIMGVTNPNEEHRIEEFKEHISRAGVEGESPHALVLGCFYEHKEPYNTQLPIKMSEMSGTSLKFFMSILEGFAKQGYSQPFLVYMEKYRDDFNLLIQKER